MLSKSQMAVLLSLGTGEKVYPYRQSFRANTLASLERQGFIFCNQHGIGISTAGKFVRQLQLKADFHSWRDDLSRVSNFRTRQLRRQK